MTLLEFTVPCIDRRCTLQYFLRLRVSRNGTRTLFTCLFIFRIVFRILEAIPPYVLSWIERQTSCFLRVFFWGENARSAIGPWKLFLFVHATRSSARVTLNFDIRASFLNCECTKLIVYLLKTYFHFFWGTSKRLILKNDFFEMLCKNALQTINLGILYRPKQNAKTRACRRAEWNWPSLREASLLLVGMS